MPKQYIGMTRRQLILTGTAVGLALPVAGAGAAIAPAPQPDDTGFLVFAAGAEAVLARCYSNALMVRGAWSRREKRLLQQMHARHRSNVDRVNAALTSDDRIPLDDFSRVVPVTSRDDAIATARRLERLAGGAYLTGVGDVADAGTRILLGRLLAVCTRNDAVLAQWAGAALGGLPNPISLEAAGDQLDNYLKDPS